MKRFLFLILLAVYSLYAGWSSGTIDLKLQDQERFALPTDGKSFEMISFEGMSYTEDFGAPLMPVKYYLIAAPTDGDIAINVNFGKKVTLENVNLLPAQLPKPDAIEKYIPDFQYKEDVYSKNEFYPKKRYEISDKIVSRGIAYYQVAVYPAQYNPVTKQYVYNEDTNVNYSVSGSFQIDERLYSKEFLSSTLSLCENGKDFVKIPSVKVKNTREEGAKYLIITHPDFMLAAKKLAAWKSKLGFSSKIATTDETGVTEPELINYIKNGYENWDTAPEYVCLLGDAGDDDGNIIIPTGYHYFHPANGSSYPSGHKTATDLYYGCVDGNDYQPDINVARMSCDNAQEALMQVERVINYEMNPPENDSFYDTMISAAYFQDDEGNGYATRRFAQTSEEMRDYMIQAHAKTSIRHYFTESNINPMYWNSGVYNPPGQWPIPTELLRSNGFEWNASGFDVTNTINNGVFLVTHRDHGSTNGWAEPAFPSGLAGNLQNGDLKPVVLSINCETGFFDNETEPIMSVNMSDDGYFAEQWTRNENGGAVAYIGATRISYSGRNDHYAEALLNGMTGYAWTDDINSYSDDFEGFNTLNFSEAQYQPGVALNYAKMYFLRHYAYGNQYTRLGFEEFILFGDPAMRMWMDTPQEFNITNLSYDDTQVTFTCPTDDITVTITDGYGNIYGTNISKSRSDYNIQITEPITFVSGLILTVSKAGYKPYMEDLDIQGSTPQLVMSPENITHTLNGGQSIDMTISLTNNTDQDYNFMLSTDKEDNSGTILEENNIETLTGHDNVYGMEYDGQYFWATSQGESSILNPNFLFKLDRDGSVLESYEQPTTSHTGFGDLVIKDGFLYAGDDDGFYKINPQDGSTETLFTTLPYSLSKINALSYIPDMGFVAAGNGTDFYIFDETGAEISILTNPGVSLPYGLAYDRFNNSLWVMVKEGPNSNKLAIVEYKIATQSVGKTITIEMISGLTTQRAQGLFLSENFFDGKIVLGGVVDGVPENKMFIIDLEDIWLTTPETSGTVSASSSQDITISLSAQGILNTTKEANIVVTDGFSSYEIPVSLTVTGVGIDEDIIADDFRILGNYPNPFNPSTTIKFSLPEASVVKMTVYNAKGEMVKKLISDTMEKGIHSVKFDANKFNSGVYYYKIDALNQIKSGKMLLVK